MLWAQPLDVSRNQRIEPVQPTRSANTVAGMSGTSLSSSRTRGSNAVNDVGPGVRSYLGGASEFTASITVVREIPNRWATCTRPSPPRDRRPDREAVLYTTVTRCNFADDLGRVLRQTAGFLGT